jgi:hypothetical protein
MRPSSPSPTGREDDGFMVADALIAVMVAGLGLAAAIQAQAMVQRMGRSAVELRLGAAEAAHHLAADWPALRRPGELSGRSGPGGLMEWTLAAQAMERIGPVRICAIQSRVRFRGSGRVILARTRRLCPVEG